MRIGVDYRFLSAGVLAVNRGMGRYTQQQLRETLALDEHNEYILFCLPDADRTLILPSILAAPNVTVAEIDISQTRRLGPVTIHTDRQSILRHAEEYQDWIYKQRVDLYHATAPYVWYDIPLIDFNVCPYVSTYYDAIPLAYSPYYLSPGSLLAELCVYANEVTRRSDRLIAISNSARQDAINYLGFREERIDIAYPIADPWFRPLDRSDQAARLAALRKRLELDAGYVMSVPHLHYSKNFENIVKGYALLPGDIRASHPLVVVCHLSEPEMRNIRALTDELQVTDSVRLTGFVSEDELVALYGQATVFLHASRYEGFGLPALEAMHCGAPVVASSTSSLPEVVGEAAVLVDPNDPASIAEGVRAVVSSESLQEEMRAKGFEQARLFTGERLGRATLDSYARTAAKPAEEARLRVAFWAPLPPLPTGAGDYSAELLEYLNPELDIEVFVDDGYLPDDRLWQSLKLNHHTGFARRQEQKPFDVIVYQLGASEYHWYMYEPLKRWPGLVTLHDLTWSHVQHLMHHRRGDMRGFRKLIETLDGPDAAAEFDAVWAAAPEDRPLRLEEFLNGWYLLRDVVEGSRGVIVPTEGLGAEVIERYGDRTPVHTILMGVTDPCLDAPGREKDILRLEYDLDPEAFVVGVFGSIAPVKRLSQIFQAFHTLRLTSPNAVLLIVGEGPEAHRAELDRLALDLGITDSIRYLGHIPVMDATGRQAFHRALQICDVVVNLRWPSHKQMSGTLARAIAAGKPVVITDLPEWGHLPETFCVRIPADQHEVAALAEILSRMARDAGLTATMSQAARAYFEEHATLSRMASHYLDLIADQASQGAARRVLARPTEPEKPAFNRPLAPEDLRSSALQSTIRRLECGGQPAEHDQVVPRVSLTDTVQGLVEQALSQRHDETAARRILVVGAGAHGLIFDLSQSAEVWAIDDYLGTERRLARMLTYPQALAPEGADLCRLRVQHGDPRALNLPDAHFDVVVALRPLHQLAQTDEIEGLLAEFRRLVRNDGVVFLPVEVALFTPPGREAAAQELGVQSVQGLTQALVGSGFHAPAFDTPSVSHDDVVPPRLDLGAERLPDYAALVNTPVAITQGVVHSPCLLRIEPDARPTGLARSGPLRKRVRRAALAAADSLIAHNPVSRSAQPSSTPSSFADIFQREAMNTHLDSALQAFDRQRLRGWYNKTLARLPGPISAFVRTIARIVYLGHTQAAQQALYTEMVQSIHSLEKQTTAAARRGESLAADLQSTQLDQARLSQQVESQVSRDMERGQIQALKNDLGTALKAIASLEADKTALQVRLAQLQARLDEQVSRQSARLDSVEASASTTRAYQEQEEDIRLLRSRLRRLEQAWLSNGDAFTEPALTPTLFRDLLQDLEHKIPTLATRTAVEVSVQLNREDLIEVAADYFADRLSAAAQVYRAPNDAWIHVDFTADADRQVLFVSACNRLAKNGLLVVVSHSEVTPVNVQSGLEKIDAIKLDLPDYSEPVVANVWVYR